MTDAGVQVVPTLQVGLLRTMFARLDLRNHRKLAVIDGRIGYTGSQNIADPKVFKQEAGHGEWIDAMVRVTGPVVEAMQVTILADWEFETYEGIDQHAADFDLVRNEPAGQAMGVPSPEKTLGSDPDLSDFLLLRSARPQSVYQQSFQVQH